MNSSSTTISDLKSVLEKIITALDLPSKKVRLKELETKSQDPGLWNDQNKARKVMQELSDLKNEIDEIKNLQDEINTLLELSKNSKEDFSKEIKSLNKAIKALELKAFLSDPYDPKNAIMSLHAGQGGTEAMDWTSMLFRMYMRYCERRGWKVDVLDETPGEEAGTKSVVFKVQGSYAFGNLKNESGTHRLVRQSPFNADKLRQTSFCLVEVMPELEEIDAPDIKIRDEDLDWQFFRSSGSGGQNVNKVSTAVRLTHKPTGLTVTAQTERRQEQNRKNALDLLRAKLWIKFLQEQEKETKGIKGEYHPATWGTQIRSYVLHPYKMVKDLRTQVETSDTEGVLNGNLDKFIEAELKL